MDGCTCVFSLWSIVASENCPLYVRGEHARNFHRSSEGAIEAEETGKR